MRRVLRIFPLLLRVHHRRHGSWRFADAPARSACVRGASYWVYMQNYALAFDDEVLRWTAHFWSLAIEEQFYFVWPMVARAGRAQAPRPSIPVLVFAVVALRGFIDLQGRARPGARDASLPRPARHREVRVPRDLHARRRPPARRVRGRHASARSRIPSWWRGVACASRSSSRRRSRCAGLTSIAHGLNDYDRRIMAIGYVTLALFFAAIDLDVRGRRDRERTRRFLSSQPLVACGKVSYGMYIFHWPLVISLVPGSRRCRRAWTWRRRCALVTASSSAASRSSTSSRRSASGSSRHRFLKLKQPLPRLYGHLHCRERGVLLLGADYYGTLAAARARQARHPS